MVGAHWKRPSAFLLESWLELHRVLEAHPDVRRLLVDPVTSLPTTPLLFPRIQEVLETRGEVSLLCVNIVRYSKIEEIYGWRVFDEVVRVVAAVLAEAAGSVLRSDDQVAELMVSGNAFLIVLSPPRNKEHVDAVELAAVAERLEDRVRERVVGAVNAELASKFACYVGASTILRDPNTRPERLVHEGIERALADSGSREEIDQVQRRLRLAEIIEAGDIRTFAHPIFRLGDMAVIGYEALSRGPAGGEFEHPDKLFAVAYDADLVLRLERLCRRRALEAARDLPAGRLLFMNIEPEAVADPELREATLGTLLADAGLTPDRIVLEITERTAIADFQVFRSTLEFLRALGFHVAVDDAGAGYGSLQCLAEVRPEWLKIDISLVRGIDTDEVRRHLMSSLVAFARSCGVGLIAEGIETHEELETLKALGVEHGQGFLFSLPVPPFPPDDMLPPL